MSTNNKGQVEITEDEAALYDRQIRLWGLEAQQRMRNAKILVAGLRGTATEVVKNIVLSGIGKLVMVDSEDVTQEDLGAGFFYRDEDVGKKRVLAAKQKVESLNPLVLVESIPTLDIMDAERLDATVQGVDLVCVTDMSRDALFKINEACRRLGKPFYAGGTYGLLGYIFCDLLDHEYIIPDRLPSKEGPKNSTTTSSYVPLQEALQHRWSALTKRQTKELNPAIFFVLLAIWEFQDRHGSLPDRAQQAPELQDIANAMLTAADVNRQTITSVPAPLIDSITTTAKHEFSPVCAVVGGMLAQDILKALSKRESPIANFLVFDGNVGGATVCRMNMLS